MKCGFNDDKDRYSCQKEVVIGLPYCWIHLVKKQSLRIMKSKFGKGLFAQNTIRFNKNNNEIIFKKGEIIGLYLGEILTDVDLSKRYGGDRNTAPYAL